MISKYAIFCSVIELGSFTKTAEQLNYSQSAVSQTIKNLEKEIGTYLLTRGHEGVKLTKDGKTLYPYFQQIVQGEKQLTKIIEELQGLNKAEIRIGIFTSASRNFILPFIKNFKAKHPAVNFVLKQGDYTSIHRWLDTGQVDLDLRILIMLDIFSRISFTRISFMPFYQVSTHWQNKMKFLLLT